MNARVRVVIGIVVGCLAVALVVGTVIVAQQRDSRSSTPSVAQTPQTSSTPQTADAVAPRIAFIGDEISSGSGAGPRQGYAYSVARSMCFTIGSLSYPDSGYVSSGQTGGTFGSRVADVLSGAPRYVVVQGAVGDDGRRSDRVSGAATEVLARLTRALGAQSVFVILPFVPPGVPAPTTASAVRRAATAQRVNVIDPGGARWLSGGDFVTPGGYLTQRGHDTLAARVVTELRRFGVPRGPGCSDGAPVPST